MKRKVIFLFILLVLVAGEFILKKVYGFTDAVLFQRDPQIEYMAIPYQNRYRFGNNICYNEYSMRSDPLENGSRRILGLGDSILNGGVLCDQSTLATYLLEQEIKNKTGQNFQVLNISAPSWGPDNAMAYLKKYGNFNADLIFLVTSSHDAYDNMNFSTKVGIHKNYPNKQYNFAYLELMERYLFPWVGKKIGLNKETAGGFEKLETKKIFNPGFQELLDYTRGKNIPFIIYLHPELSEVKKEKFNKKGHLILAFAQQNNIPVITGLENARKTHYLDYIHLNEKGQEYLFKQLYPAIKEIIFQ